MAIDCDRFSADNLTDMAAATRTIVEVGANPFGSGVTWWCKILRHVGKNEYETTYGEDAGSLDSAWSVAWSKFVRDQRKRAESANAEASDAERILNAMVR